MKTADAAKQIITLLEEGIARGARSPSLELRAFLDELALSPGLKKPRKKASTPRKRPSGGSTTRVAARRKKPTEEQLAKTIEQLAQRLRDAFDNATTFETVLSDPETQSLSKENVVSLYNRVFESAPSGSMTKPELFNAMRRERINYVRGRR